MTTYAITPPTSYGNLTLSTGTYNPYSIIAAGTGTGTSYTWSQSPATGTVKITSSGIEMEKNCDITFGNIKLSETLASIESRLAILRINHALESEWEELKALGDAYRALEKEIQEKLEVWEKLKHVDK